MPKMKKKFFGDFCPLGITPAGVIEFIRAYLCVCVYWVCVCGENYHVGLCMFDAEGWIHFSYVYYYSNKGNVGRTSPRHTHIQSIRAE